MKLHTLGDYYQLLQKHGLLSGGGPDGADLTRPVALVSCDSRDVVPDTLFICKGVHFQPGYLRDAVAKGATVYMAETPYPEGAGASYLGVTDVRRAMALFADLYYNHPSGAMQVVGITGTKGKSSTTYYLRYIFDEFLAAQGKPRSGVISSIDTYDGVDCFESHITTPEPLELERHFHHGVSTGMEYLTMEVSSQALKYDRVVNVEFAAAVFLNIGLDHISPIEHPDFEDYFAAKLRIFEQAKVACVNLDSDHAGRVLAAAQASPRVITFSQIDETAQVYGSAVHKSGNDTIFRVKTARYAREFRLTMPGLFNVENALAAIAVCEGLGIPEQHIYVGLMKARVPGRMEIYTNADDKVIAIVDYAHNRMSFEKLFRSVREEYPGRRVITVFGCPGKKAFDRRRDLGEISGRYSDLVILTEEDSGEEDTESICREIARYVDAERCDFSILPDRGEAIRRAVMDSEEPSVLLITGKGAETRQKRGTAYIDCPSDVTYAREALREYDIAHGLDGMEKVRAVLSVLPALKAYDGKTVVIKYGGSTLDASGVQDSILQDVAALRMLGARVVLVHGGGKNITALMRRMGVEARFEHGYRVTDEAALDCAEMALSAQVNKAVVTALAALGTAAVGISGKDGGLLTAVCKDAALGRVGEIAAVDTRLIDSLLDAGYLPVVSPVAAGTDGMGYNCNADDAACAVAAAMGADKLIFLTDADGVLTDRNNETTRIASMDAARARELIDSGLIAGGMVPKVLSCVHAVEQGVGEVLILDGRVEHAVLLEVVSQKAPGTTITS